jgi:hypothetical protein
MRAVRRETATASPLALPCTGGAAVAPTALAAILAATLGTAPFGVGPVEQRQEKLAGSLQSASTSAAAVLSPRPSIGPAVAAIAAEHSAVLRGVMRGEARPRRVNPHDGAGLRAGPAGPAVPGRLPERPRGGADQRQARALQACDQGQRSDNGPRRARHRRATPTRLPAGRTGVRHAGASSCTLAASSAVPDNRR